MVTVELLKVIVQPVLLERDASGAIIGERVGEQVALYDDGQVAEYVAALRAELAAQTTHEREGA